MRAHRCYSRIFFYASGYYFRNWELLLGTFNDEEEISRDGANKERHLHVFEVKEIPEMSLCVEIPKNNFLGQLYDSLPWTSNEYWLNIRFLLKLLKNNVFIVSWIGWFSEMFINEKKLYRVVQ